MDYRLLPGLRAQEKTVRSSFKQVLTYSSSSETVYRRGARRWNKKIYYVNGHSFEPKRLNPRTTCTVCTDAIWGLGRAGMRCAVCGMCVHKKCHKSVRSVCVVSQRANELAHSCL